MYKLLEKSGFKPDFVLGHSFGELTALWAAGGLSDRSFYQLAIDRGNAMQLSTSEESEPGAMLAVNATEQVLQSLMAKFADVTITNYNSNHQTVLGGSKRSIMDLQQKFSHAGIKATLLPVANAFHTQFVKSAAEPLAEKIFQTSFNRPSIPIYSNVTAQPYPQEPEEIKKLLATHLLNPVAFKQSIEAIYDRGGRVFLEIGPKNVLTSFVKEVLEDKEHLAIAINLKSEKGEEYEFRRAILQLLIAGMELKTFDPYALAKPVEEVKSKPSLSIALNGGFYLNPDTKKLRQQALVEKDTSLWDTYVKSSLTNSNLPIEHPTPLDPLEFNPISMQVLR
jgi:acyl transferase domain-containing protein